MGSPSLSLCRRDPGAEGHTGVWSRVPPQTHRWTPDAGAQPPQNLFHVLRPGKAGRPLPEWDLTGPEWTQPTAGALVASEQICRVPVPHSHRCATVPRQHPGPAAC